ncbi:hypothetical protein BRADI_3g46597v3 [Brachypodium distachyon]|uniref:Uncharacterized protein n=1 Tax=Brachypodium distachyon TaxID=15368 RepID=A0A2K2D3N2_BRADI|nr:hypothetical protein BRADI_3g46597v3 [Brachypodium distachyon]
MKVTMRLPNASNGLEKDTTPHKENGEDLPTVPATTANFYISLKP